MGSSEEWQWVHLTGGNAEQQVADVAPGRCCIVVQTNSRVAFHVVFSASPGPSRGSAEPVLRFVVGKRKNSMTSVGLGNPYQRKEPLDFTRSSDALLTADEEKSRTYWFLYDSSVGVAAMGAQGSPQSDLCRLACRFHGGAHGGFKADICEGVRYISLSSGKYATSLRVVQVCEPPDISIPKFRFDPLLWSPMPWNGDSFIFEPDDVHRQLIEKVQRVLAKSILAPFYGMVPAKCFCLNAYRLLDPLRRGELLTPERRAAGEEPDWLECHQEVHHRLQPVLVSAPWTYFPLQFDRTDCTTIRLAPISQGGTKTISEWCNAVKQTTGLRNGATNRDMLTITFAFEVFPVVGENLVEARRGLIKEITTLLEKEWGWMEFRCPFLACWHHEHEYMPYDKL